ncbi:hypothetical protein HK102_010739, partial [Quaeritorhiza haematococci]
GDEELNYAEHWGSASAAGGGTGAAAAATGAGAVASGGVAGSAADVGRSGTSLAGRATSVNSSSSSLPGEVATVADETTGVVSSTPSPIAGSGPGSAAATATSSRSSSLSSTSGLPLEISMAMGARLTDEPPSAPVAATTLTAESGPGSASLEAGTNSNEFDLGTWATKQLPDSVNRFIRTRTSNWSMRSGSGSGSGSGPTASASVSTTTTSTTTTTTSNGTAGSSSTITTNFVGSIMGTVAGAGAEMISRIAPVLSDSPTRSSGGAAVGGKEMDSFTGSTSGASGVSGPSASWSIPGMDYNPWSAPAPGPASSAPATAPVQTVSSGTSATPPLQHADSARSRTGSGSNPLFEQEVESEKTGTGIIGSSGGGSGDPFLSGTELKSFGKKDTVGADAVVPDVAGGTQQPVPDIPHPLWDPLTG